MSSAYFEKYSAMYDKNYGYEGPQGETAPNADPYGEWDTGLGEDDFYQEAMDEFGDNSETSWDDPNYQGEEFGEDFGGTQGAKPLTRQEERRIKRIQENEAKIFAEYQETQQEYQELKSGKISLEDRNKQLDALEKELDGLIKDIEDISEDKKKLSKDGLNFDAILETDSFDNDIGSGESEDIPSMDEGFKEEVEGLKKEIESEDAQVEDQIKGNEIKDEISALEETDEEHREEIKNKFLHSVGFVTGANGRQYGTAKVWGKKHVKNHHSGVTDQAEALLKTMADSAGSGEWSAVISQVEAIDGSEVDNTLGVVYTILEKEHPDLLNEIPSEVLEVFATNILDRGNNPDGGSIVRVDSKEKYSFGDFMHNLASGGWSAFSNYDKHGNKRWTLRDDRRRDSLKKIGTKYSEAARAFQQLAQSKKAEEDKKAGKLEELHKQLQDLGMDYEMPSSEPEPEPVEDEEEAAS